MNINVESRMIISNVPSLYIDTFAFRMLIIAFAFAISFLYCTFCFAAVYRLSFRQHNARNKHLIKNIHQNMCIQFTHTTYICICFLYSIDGCCHFMLVSSIWFLFILQFESQWFFSLFIFFLFCFQCNFRCWLDRWLVVVIVTDMSCYFNALAQIE